MLYIHLQRYWANHLGASFGTLWAFLNGSTILSSIIAGIAVFAITSLLQKAYKWIKSKLVL